MPAIGAAGDNKWHLLVFAWSKNKIFMSIDGAPLSSKELTRDISDSALPSAHFSIGAESLQSYLLDELTIYSRKLSDTEIVEIWQRGNKAINENIE